jgi:hypothetical protein
VHFHWEESSLEVRTLSDLPISEDGRGENREVPPEGTLVEVGGKAYFLFRLLSYVDRYFLSGPP